MPTHRVSCQLCVATRSSHAWAATTPSTTSRNPMRMPFHTVWLFAALRLQARNRPAAGTERVPGANQCPRPAGAIVNARRPFRPQLNRIRPQTVAAPVRRAGNVDPEILIHARGSWNRGAEPARLLDHGGFERRTRGYWFALGAGAGAQTLVP